MMCVDTVMLPEKYKNFPPHFQHVEGGKKVEAWAGDEGEKDDDPFRSTICFPRSCDPEESRGMGVIPKSRNAADGEACRANRRTRHDTSLSTATNTVAFSKPP